VIDFDELRELAADVRIFVDAAEDKAAALRDIIAAHDVVLAIFPSSKEGTGLHVVKGGRILDKIAKSRAHALYTHTAIAVPDIHTAELLSLLMAPVAVAIAA
jgi:hypothetical protein